MNQTDNAPRPQRNLVTRQKHRHETLWQITVPLVIAILIFFSMAIMAVAGTAAQASIWADISMIWLIAPTYVFALIGLVILAASIYGIVRLILVLPIYTSRALVWLKNFGTQVKLISNKAVEPFLRVQGFMASTHALGRNIRGKGSGSRTK